MTPEFDDIEATGHAYWVPIPLDVPPATLHDALLERFRGSDPEALVTANASAIVGVSRTLGSESGDLAAEGVRNLAGWALLHDPEHLSVRGFAVLRVSVLDEATTADDCVRLVIAGETLYQPPVVEPMETRSGEALSVRFRPMVDEDGDSQVHQVSSVLWPRPADRVLFVLTTYSTDLVEAAQVADRLDELGAGIRGL